MTNDLNNKIKFNPHVMAGPSDLAPRSTTLSEGATNWELAQIYSKKDWLKRIERNDNLGSHVPNLLMVVFMIFTSERQFRLWDYNISHRQILLRSCKSEAETDNIDIVFWGVEWISLPTTLEGIQVDPSDSTASAARTANIPPNAVGKLYRVVSDVNEHLILAQGCRVMSNLLDTFDSSLVYAGIDRKDSEYGVILAKG